MKNDSRLGPYTILEPLGAGGMGEVWLADDTRLGRKVAIKVLPESVADDAASAARLEQEARLLAQLEHPNVASVYGLERTRPDDSGDEVLCLVMQYAEGETLADRIAAGPVPLDEALEVARQIAAGVGAAHDRGIIHRDLKPGNVMLAEGPAGRQEVKVLDFGLAKALVPDREDSSRDLTASPTMAAATAAGVILGTAAYMSPEQARGKSVDRRTDVWAYGCLLYEMLTGKTAFAGETVSDILAAILKEEPDLDALPAGTPGGVRRALQRCLTKEPDGRPFDVRDVALDLGLVEPAADTEERTPSPRSRAGLAIVAGAILVIGLLAGSLISVVWRGRDEGAIGGLPDRFTPVTTQAGAEAFPSLSADGEWVVYASQAAGNWDVYLQSIGGDNPINLTAESDADETAPALSPDGRQIAFRSERGGGGIFVMGRTGESVRRISDAGHNPAWSPDGRFLAVADEAIGETPLSRDTTSSLRIIDLQEGGERTLETGDAVQPSWSPDGRRLVYWGNQEDSGQRDLWTVAVDGGRPVSLTNDPATDWTPVWGADGASVYFSSDRAGTMGIWRIQVDPVTWEPVEAPVAVLPGGADWVAYPSFSVDGSRLVYAVMRTSTQAYRLDLDPSFRAAGEPALVTPGSRRVISPSLSPDGQWLAFGSGETQQEDIYLLRLDGSELRRLTNDSAKDRAPRFSPDGSQLTFYSDRSGKYRAWTVDVDGSNLRLIEAGEGSYSLPNWSADGTEVIVNAGIFEPLGSLSRVRVAGPEAGSILEVSVESPQGYSALASDWSPDGLRLLVNYLDALGRWGGVATHDLETGVTTQLLDFGYYPYWLPDSRHLVFRTLDELWVADADTGETWQVLSVAPGHVHEYPSASRTESSVVYSLHTHDDDLWMAEWERK